MFEQPVPIKFTCELSEGMSNILDAPQGAKEDIKELPLWLAK
jgi:hypothetical protein